VFGKFEEVNLSSCNLPVTFALKDTPNLGILDLSVRFLAGAFWRESFSGLPSTHPSYLQRTKATHHFDHPRAALPITCFNDVVDRPIPTLTIKPDYSSVQSYERIIALKNGRGCLPAWIPT
jgi:hypothetical protein